MFFFHDPFRLVAHNGISLGYSYPRIAGHNGNIYCHVFFFNWDALGFNGEYHGDRIWLVVSTPLKILVSWDHYSQYIEK